jgi:glucose/arabinose dehydrogenase
MTDSHPTSPVPARRRTRVWVGVALVAVAGPTAAVVARKPAAVKSALRKVGLLAPAPVRPSVAAVRPGKDETVIACDAYFAADVSLPNAGASVDPATVNSGSVRLVRRGESTPIPARVNTSAAGDSLVLTPEQPLEPNSLYRFEVLPALKDTSGASFEFHGTWFTTGGLGGTQTVPVAFEKVALPQTAGHGFTGVTTGPDGRLYACTYDGSIFRYDLAADGTIAAVHEINTVKSANGKPRLITGITFAPGATAADPVLYVSHGQCTLTAADDWTGSIARLTGPELTQYQELIVGLPRASRDHLNNQMAFGPDGALYFGQASNSAMGAPDGPWGMRPEHRLNATILRVDLAKLSAAKLPLDVKTEAGGTYDPAAAAAPVTVYATGLRNVYDLVWHRNGQLYATLNGSGAGGNTPAFAAGHVPGLKNVPWTVPDHLAAVRPGSFHGHPNPTIGQHVLMGGNPTAGRDELEVAGYPVGTMPESGWTPPALSFGRNLSPCGIIEYRGSEATRMLDGAMFVCRYSGGKDVCVVVPNADGTIREMITGIDGLTRFADPLDLAQHPATGHLYVAEFGGRRLTLVRAKAGYESARVYRTAVNAAQAPAPADEVARSGQHPSAAAR